MRARSSRYALLVVLTVGGACSKNASPIGDAASDATTSKDSDSPSGDGSSDVSVGPPAGLTFPDAPPMSCGGDAGACPFPPSACGTSSCDSGQCPNAPWVVYYDAPVCVSGQCVFTKRFFECQGEMACSNGGCPFNMTIP
jgi:hypothetical protein